MMDGIHDMGGLQGFGAVAPNSRPGQAAEPIFHHDWEARVFALTSAVPFTVPFTDDQLRPAIEAIPPERYLTTPYYGRWLTALEQLLAERGALAGTFASGAEPARADGVLPAIFAGASQARPLTPETPARFQVGDRVRTLMHFGPGHNRLPRYARNQLGRIASRHGAFLVADANSEGRQQAEMLYTVEFQARDLWSDTTAGDTVMLDLWDRYLLTAA